MGRAEIEGPHPAWSMRCFQAEVPLATRELRGRTTIKFTQVDRDRSGFAARDEIEGPSPPDGAIFFEARRPAAPAGALEFQI
jgi:hypothetical protein